MFLPNEDLNTFSRMSVPTNPASPAALGSDENPIPNPSPISPERTRVPMKWMMSMSSPRSSDLVVPIKARTTPPNKPMRA